LSEFRFLERAIQRGALVNYAGFIAGKAIIFANTVVLARLLAPEHFGLVAIGLLVLSISDAVTEAGTGAAVVWRRGQLETTIAVALSLALISSAVMTLFIILLASPIADFFDEPEAADIVRVLAVCVLLSSVTGVFSAILQRHLQFGRRLVPEIARAGIKGAVGIPMALAGFGVWSLVYSHVAALFIGLLLSAWLSGWAPRLSLSRPVVRDILPYSLHIAAIGLLGLATKKLDIVIIGHRFPADVLGYYTVAFMLVELVILGICWSASQALFPALSQTSQDPARLRLV